MDNQHYEDILKQENLTVLKNNFADNVPSSPSINSTLNIK